MNFDKLDQILGSDKSFYNSTIYKNIAENLNLSSHPHTEIQRGTERVVFLYPNDHLILGVEYDMKSQEYLDMYKYVSQILYQLLPNHFPNVLEAKNINMHSVILGEFIEGNKIENEKNRNFIQGVVSLEKHLRRIGYKLELNDIHPDNFIWNGVDLVYVDKLKIVNGGLKNSPNDPVNQSEFYTSISTTNPYQLHSAFNEKSFMMYISKFPPSKQENIIELYANYTKNLQTIIDRSLRKSKTMQI